MTIVASRRYQDGKPVEDWLDLETAPPAPEGAFDWVGLHDPTPAELELIKRRFCLHQLAVEDALNQNHQPKAESYGESLFVIARTAQVAAGEAIAYGQTAVFLGKDFVVTVRQGSARDHSGLRAMLELHPERLAEGPDFVLHAVLDFVVDGYIPILDELDQHVIDMEENAVTTFPDQARIRRIFRLRRTLRRFEVVAGQMEEVASKLAMLEMPSIDVRARPYFRDVYDHARRSVARARGLSETLTGIVEIAGLLEQSRQGAITRQLAAWAAILAVPTAIAGIYGMNFDHMPELRWTFGYPAILLVIVAICSLLFVRFRRIGWL
ncbi:magnesium and cobalt transport protein CorA [Tsuneonella sp. HG222]